MQIAAAHARGLHCDDDLAGTRRRVRKFHQLDFALAREDYAAHRFLHFLQTNIEERAYALSRPPGTTQAPKSRPWTGGSGRGSRECAGFEGFRGAARAYRS